MAGRLLILGGTAEGRALAEGAAKVAGLSVVTSLAGRTRNPLVPPGAVRIGGFGGADGLAAYLRDEAIDAVIDATHPFAAEISANAARACTAAGVARLRLARPPWAARPGDRWIDVADLNEAASVVGDHGRRIFLTVGGQDLTAFAGRFPEMPGLWFLARMIDPPDRKAALSHGEIIAARGPFDATDEQRLMRIHRIDCLVARNSGGAATYGKIEAARTLGLPVVMVRRPPGRPEADVGSVDAALDWLEANFCPA